MKKTKKKTYSRRKVLKIKLENTLTRRKNIVGFKPTEHTVKPTDALRNYGRLPSL